MITTADTALADDARVYRDQGKASFLAGGHVRLGAAWRMSEVHAAIGLVHLRRLDDFLAVRRDVAAYYDSVIGRLDGLEALVPSPRSASNYYKYPVLLAPGLERAAVKARCREHHGVSLSGEVYATPLHHEPVFADVSHPPLPVAEDLCARQICLPVHSDMTRSEAERVVAALAAVLPAALRA